MFGDFLLRSVISGSIATILYVIAGWLFTRYYNRSVQRSVLKHDFKLGIISLIFGSPILQLFGMAHEQYGISQMYMNIGDYGWVYWLVSIPLYIALWDAVFYVLHLVLHVPVVYRLSHFRHHACRPPVPWSGIAIDPFETLLSGILPYTIPLFFLPFHIYTVYALNIMLMFWATMVHSSLNWAGNSVMLSVKDHNLHHAFGRKNANFAAVFTFWDRLGGTLNRTDSPPWWGKDGWGKKPAVPVAPGTEYPDLVSGSGQ
jgi:lathosterol oxidase